MATNKPRPEQIEVSTGTANNDTVTTKGYVDEHVLGSNGNNMWSRAANVVTSEGTVTDVVIEATATIKNSATSYLNIVPYSDRVELDPGADTNELHINRGTEDMDFFVHGTSASEPLIYTDAGNSIIGFGTDNPSLTHLVTCDGIFYIRSGSLALSAGTTVNEITTSISGASTDDQIPTAKTIWDKYGAKLWVQTAGGIQPLTSGNPLVVANSSISAADQYAIWAAGANAADVDTCVALLGSFTGNTTLTSGNKVCAIRSDLTFYPGGDTDGGYVGHLASNVASHGATVTAYGNYVGTNYDYCLYAESGSLQLPSGTDVNEIVTSISGSSTDDQLCTAKAAWDAINAEDFWDRETSPINSLKPKNLGDAMKYFSAGDATYPVRHDLNLNHDAIFMFLDCYFDGTDARSSSTTGNVILRKSGGEFAIAVDNGVTAGNVISGSKAFSIDTATNKHTINGDLDLNGINCTVSSGTIQMKSSQISTATTLDIEGNGSTVGAIQMTYGGDTSAYATFSQATTTFGLDYGPNVTDFKINAQNQEVDTTIMGVTDNELVFVDASTDRVGISTNSPTVTFEVDGSAKISTGTFALNAGTTVNEIVTSISGSSTDDQLCTAKTVYDAILTGDQVSAPSGPTDTGAAGQWAYGSGYMYKCTATDTWVRWAVATTW